MKIVFVSNLFPDTAEPYRGLDNSNLLHYLSRHCTVRVISPRPTRPLAFGGKTPRRVPCLVDAQFEPQYPTALYIPKVGSAFNHLLFARAIRQPLAELRKSFPFDTILCSWIYPDGCAVARVARRNGIPFVISAQGSDVHVYLRMAFRRRLITAAANASAGVITRSRKLADLLNEAGVARERLHAAYNGVDLRTFCPGDRKTARLALGLSSDEPTILFIGNFLQIKNPLLLVTAHAELCRRMEARCRLVMIGDGPLRRQARRKAKSVGTLGQIAFVGRQPPALVARYMQAADLLCVSSDNEGVPNVILEAFACGLPVVASRVGGIPEVLCHDFLGCLVEPSRPEALARVLAQTLPHKHDTARIIQHAQQFSWEATAKAYFDVLKAATPPET